MHVESVAEPLLGLAAELSLFAFLIVFGDEMLREVLTQELCKCSRLSKHERLSQGRGFDGNHRRLTAMSFHSDGKGMKMYSGMLPFPMGGLSSAQAELTC